MAKPEQGLTVTVAGGRGTGSRRWTWGAYRSAARCVCIEEPLGSWKCCRALIGRRRTGYSKTDGIGRKKKRFLFHSPQRPWNSFGRFFIHDGSSNLSFLPSTPNMISTCETFKERWEIITMSSSWINRRYLNKFWCNICTGDIIAWRREVRKELRAKSESYPHFRRWLLALDTVVLERRSSGSSPLCYLLLSLGRLFSSPRSGPQLYKDRLAWSVATVTGVDERRFYFVAMGRPAGISIASSSFANHLLELALTWSHQVSCRLQKSHSGCLLVLGRVVFRPPTEGAEWNKQNKKRDTKQLMKLFLAPTLKGERYLFRKT